MNILFIHQNYPGQYREIVPTLAAMGGHRVVFLTQRTGLPQATGHMIGVYKSAHKPAPNAWKYSAWFEESIGNAIGVGNACKLLKQNGFEPDIVTGHANWGELLYVKDIWPNAPLLGYFEYYFIAKGGLIGFDPEFREAGDIGPRLFANNAINHLSFERCDYGITATEWQKSTHPASMRDKLAVIHEGIRTDRLIPDHDSEFVVEFPAAKFARGEEIVTYVARNLEPARGFHTMMRSLPRLQALRPQARVAIVGGDEVSYGFKLAAGETFRGWLTRELGDSVDWSRVHFLGQIPYEKLIALLKLARCHVYLTAPFVPSWSFLESMALEKTIVASDVGPIREIMSDGETGLLVDFFQPTQLAERIADVLAHETNYRMIGNAARKRILSDYDFKAVTFPRLKALVNNWLPQQIRF
ncbi:MAG: glycosyltransferase [Enhydrobacter sp.]|nr:glycosyltransferase [Enhydrobacter sp.]